MSAPPAAKQQQQQKGAKAAAGGASAAAATAVDLKSLPTPDFWAHRIAIFERLYAEQQAAYAAKAAPITITMPDGSKRAARSWETTPLAIAQQISNSLPEKVFVAKVNDALWDLTRPFEGDATLELLEWDSPDARKVFWHSSAHVLGYALERVFGAKLSVGPPLEDGGFFYEGATARAVSEADYKSIEAAMLELAAQKAPYQRLVIAKRDALELFNYTEFKSKILAAKVPEDGTCTVYRCGALIDPCRGPHLPHTGAVKALRVNKNSSSYFEGKADQAVLQRVYAIAFPKKALLDDWVKLQEEAAKRDHRTIGRQQELFGFHEVSPGSAFWLPHGARIYNALIEFQRRQYRARGFEEVVTPNIYNSKLWMVSGHWEKYSDAMFKTVCEHEDYGLKPMNCPGHCIMFGMRPRSYKELPVRFADFGTLHRNELSGALTGLTRVRRFQQDDAHIFCRMDQVQAEIEGALGFLQDVYGILGFKFYLKHSTRPPTKIGTDEVWDVAERYLSAALNAFCGIPAELPDPFSADGKTFAFNGQPADIKKLKALQRKLAKDPAAAGGWAGPKFEECWEENPGDGAFYGPKIDIVVEDALRRRHQCATIQLDFNLPERFGLRFTKATPAHAAAAAAAASAGEDESAAPAADAAAAAAGKKDKKKHQHADPADAASSPSAPASPDAAAAAAAAAPAAPLTGVALAQKELHIDTGLDPNQERPVMIHRAIFGSLERCIAILCEHYAGKWPFWLSPRQVVIVPVGPFAFDFALRVRDELHRAGFFADADLSPNTLDRKIRDAEVTHYNFVFVVGKDEEAKGEVSIRSRNKQIGNKTVADATKWLQEIATSYSTEY